MNQAQLTVTIKALRQQPHEHESITVCCNTCEQLQAGVCQVHHAAPPEPWRQGPIDCPHWQWDQVPF